MPCAIQMIYLFDPLCGWCYAAAPVIAQLAARPDFDVRPLPTGLFAGSGARTMNKAFADFAWSNDQRIARLTGQPFSEAYRRDVLGDESRPFDSEPATLALAAVSLEAPDQVLAALKAFQRLRYVEGRDTADIAVLAAGLRALDLSSSAERLERRDDILVATLRTQIAAGQDTLRRCGARGVPTLLVETGAKQHIVSASELFAGTPDMLVAKLKAV